DKVGRVGQLRTGVSKEIKDPAFSPDTNRGYVVADMITGFGVAEAVKHYYGMWHYTDVKGKKVIVQGWGNVGSAAAYYMAQMGARIVGIIDRSGGIIETNGLGLEEIRNLFLNKKGNTLQADNMLDFDQINKQIWSLGADVFL